MMRSKLFLILFLLTNTLLFASKNDSEIIEYKTHFTVSSIHVLSKTVNVIIQINNRAGEDLCNISVFYSKKNKITEMNAWIEDINGNIIRRLKTKDIIEKSYISDISLYEDDYIKTFNLKHNVYPYRIVYNYSIDYDEFFHITDWNPILNYEVPTKKAKLIIEVPTDYKILIDQKNISEPTIDSLKFTVRHIWSTSFNGNIKYEIFSPPTIDLLPHVKIIPIKFNYGIEGLQDSWISFGDWVCNLNDGLDILPQSEKKIIDKILKNKSSTKEKINALYNYVQNNTRYINVKLDIGGFKPYSAAYVSENKYGDCKALSNYMKSILSYSGINSYYSLINAGEEIKPINHNFTSSQFNHVILFVPGEQDTTWLECTNKYSPTGYLGSFTQDRYALIIQKDKSKLIKTPKLSVNDVEQIRSITFKLITDESVFVDFKSILKGDEYITLEGFNQTLNNDQKNKYIHRLIPFKNYELKDWKIENSGDNTSLSFIVQLNLKNYFETYDNLKFVNLFSSKIPSFEKPNKRTQAVKIDYPINIKDSLVYHGIPEYELKLLKDTCLESKYGAYILKNTLEDNKLIVNKQFILFSGNYSIEEYPDFFAFITEIKNVERKNPIIYQKNGN